MSNYVMYQIVSLYSKNQDFKHCTKNSHQVTLKYFTWFWYGFQFFNYIYIYIFICNRASVSLILSELLQLPYFIPWQKQASTKRSHVTLVMRKQSGWSKNGLFTISKTHITQWNLQDNKPLQSSFQWRWKCAGPHAELKRNVEYTTLIPMSFHDKSSPIFTLHCIKRSFHNICYILIKIPMF